MHLNERKIKILEAIINDYIETGEPIGSRTIAKKYNFGISSATIRNEMSDLEELGFIIQPHTSSGRIPSNKGYRLYVDSIINYRELTSEEVLLLKSLINNNISKIDEIMQQTAKAISILTNYTTIVSKPKVNKDKIKYFQLMFLDETSIIVILVTEKKLVENHIIKKEYDFQSEDLAKITNILNEIIKNYNLEQIKSSLNTIIEDYNLKVYEKDTIKKVLKISFKRLEEIEEEIEIFTTGVNNILGFPEFSDLEKAKNIFQTLEEKELLLTLFENSKDTSNGHIQILIGDENNIEIFKNCSIIKSEYKINDSTGIIGLIGPTRMDYAQAGSVLNGIVKNINKVIQAIFNI